MTPIRHLITAAVLGALGGALFALWVTVAEAQGLTLTGEPAAPGDPCKLRRALADNSTPRPKEASKPVVDEAAARCP